MTPIADQDRSGRSVWEVESEAPRPEPPLRGRARAEVAIVGGGFTGVSTAWHLQRRHPGLGVVLLEAGVLGAGASGRSGGQVLSGLSDWDDGPPEELRRLYATSRAAIELVEELARFAPEGTFRRGGSLSAFTREDRAAHALRRAEGLRLAGIPAEFLTGPELPVRGAIGALRDPQAGRLNGFALVQGLRTELRAAGVRIHERTPVRRLGGTSELVLETPEGELRAAAVVIATNSATPALGLFRQRLLPVASHVLATDPLSAETWREIGWGDWDGFSDDLDRVSFASRTPGGRLLLGGGSNAAYGYRYRGRPIPPLREGDRGERAIRAALARYFPGTDALPIRHRWVGTLAVTLDRICTIGVGGAARNVYHALGYSGHGAAMALLAGRVIADLYDGRDEAWRELPFYQRRPPWLPPEPLRWLGYQAFTRLTGRSPRRPA